jgi:N-acetyl-anhydromuramyl-L-alanine amidase AmpD
MKIVLPLVLLSAVLAAGCEQNVATVTSRPPLLSPDQVLPPVKYQRMPPMPYVAPWPTPAPSTAAEPTVAKKRHTVADNPSWAAGTPLKWTHIILHHSAQEGGNAAAIDRQHRARNWDELGYHFVIDNGNGGTAGTIEVGSRWVKQKHGAHCRPNPNDANYWNEHGIGICLVGNFETGKPSPAQMASLARLVAFLMEECQIPRDRILGHGQVAGAQTACPGRYFSYVDLFQRVDTLLKD